MQKTDTLLKPYRLSNQLQLSNKIVMAPMTRAKAENDNNPTQAMANYYAKRADAGLIITEGVIIGPDATGYDNIPGIFSNQHVEKWKVVSEAVHQNDGRIFMQLWHVGRVSHPHFINGKLPLSASATMMEGRIRRTKDLYYGQSRAATLNEIKALIQSYATAARNAIRAGFDGIEIHAANGYLIDQFLHYHTNHRTDIYGGNPENMSRFAEEIVKACADVVGYERIGVRLSPGGYLNEIVGDARDADVFAYLLSKLNDLPIAYVHTGNFDDRVKFKELGHLTMTDFIRRHYHGNLIACGSYQYAEAEKSIAQDDFDLVAIGRPFIANPDFITKLQQNMAITPYDASMLDTLN